MKKIAEKSLTNFPPIIELILVTILIFPAFSMATGPDPSNVGHAQEIQDPQRLQRALNALLRKAHGQSKMINAWYQKERLRTAQMKAKNRKTSNKAMAKDTSRRNSSYVTAMIGPDHTYTKPVEKPFEKRGKDKGFSH